ncbi:MAG: hypothetical protein LIO79_08840 [Rikenellaceae bacterium]|nr:hypothetical protein [Rikenellaceae bacterium]MCC8112543.1 hypothetical protein [Bacteroidales bacterium]
MDMQEKSQEHFMDDERWPFGERQKIMWDYENTIATAERQARVKALRRSARAMLADGLDVDKIMLYTGLTKEEIEKLGAAP